MLWRLTVDAQSAVAHHWMSLRLNIKTINPNISTLFHFAVTKSSPANCINYHTIDSPWFESS